jgi:MFS family permease
VAELAMGAVGASEAGERSLPVRHIAAVAVGNALQFYDFLTYAFFAAQIGRTFFPSHNPASSLLASLATFGAGFLTRPVGGLVIGMMGDRVGRKPAMLLSFALMGFSILGLALTPAYATIGVAAPLLVLGFRLIQGFALGGEVGPSTAYLIEAAPPRRRGLYVSFQYMTQDAAVLVAGLVGVALANLLSAPALDAWGWRLAFLIGAAIVPFGLILRGDLPETLEAAGARDEAPPLLRPYFRVAILGLVMFASAMVVNYVLTYMTTFAGETLHMRSTLAFGATVVLGISGVVFDPIGGWLSDRFGRKPVMIWPWLFLLAAGVPAFLVLAHFRNAASLFGAAAVLEIPLAISASSVLVAITESMPARIRSGAVSILYAVAVAVFGGTTQFAVTWFIQVTGSPLAPAWYLAAAATAGLVAILMFAETAPGRLKAPS